METEGEDRFECFGHDTLTPEATRDIKSVEEIGIEVGKRQTLDAVRKLDSERKSQKKKSVLLDAYADMTSLNSHKVASTQSLSSSLSG